MMENWVSFAVNLLICHFWWGGGELVGAFNIFLCSLGSLLFFDAKAQK
jgi:hypothetical protein